MTQLRSWLTGFLLLIGLLGFAAPSYAASCGPAAVQGTAPSDYQTYCWLDFSTYNDTSAKSGQAFSFSLPDGSTLKFTLKVSTSSGATGTFFHAVSVPSWSGAAFGNAAFESIPNLPVIYTSQSGTYTVTITNIAITPPVGGGTGAYGIIVADGESTNSGESLSFTTNGTAWTTSSSVPGQSPYVYPTLAGANTTTVSETGTSSGNTGSYVFTSLGNPTTVSSTMVASGLQGIVVGVRYASVSVVSKFSTTRYNAADQFNYYIKTSSGATLSTQTTSGTALTGFTLATVPTVAASFPFVISEALAAGSVSPLKDYSTSLTCTNSNSSSATVLPVNQLVTSYNFPSLNYDDAVQCVFTNTAAPYGAITGTVYGDANHNFTLDNGETGTGLSSLYVKLTALTGSSCGTTASQVVTADPTTGDFSIIPSSVGTFCLVLNGNSSTSNLTPAIPSGWIGTQNGSGVADVMTEASGTSPAPTNFGLYEGSELTGTVFDDNGQGSGTANDGVKNGGEAGVSAQTVTAASGGSAFTTGTTLGTGGYTLWIPYTYTGTLTFSTSQPAAWLATGGSAGTTGGSYTRPTVSAGLTAGTVYTGVNFGMVPPNTLLDNNAQQGQPGSVVYYAETFIAGSAGSVAFSVVDSPEPTSNVWGQTIYNDTACSGTISAADPIISAAVSVTAGQKICLVLAQKVPATAQNGASNIAAINAAMTYTNASPALSATAIVNDTTTVGQSATFKLTKMVTDVTTSTGPAISVNGNPGDTLNYSITATNNGTGPLTSVVINDSTPAYTTFTSASCPGSSPAGVTGCAVTVQPVVGHAGAIQWTISGTLMSGASETVSYQVAIQH